MSRSYLSSKWFVMDLVIIVPDWISTIGHQTLCYVILYVMIIYYSYNIQ